MSYGAETLRTTGEFDRWAAVGCIEVDRFCESCGYNMRTQSVRRELHTGVLMCRCPECGRYHAAGESSSAGQAMLRRLSVFLLLIWASLIASGLFTCGLFDFIIAAENVYDSTRYVTAASDPARQMPVSFAALQAQLPPGKAGGRVLRPLDPEHLNELMAVYGVGSLAIGIATGMLAVVTLPHWRRRGHDALVMVIPLIAAACTMVWIWDEMPHLMRFGLTVTGGHALMQILGGIAGIAVGRPLARLAVRMLVPPGWRGPLAFLWIADGKQPSMPRPTAAHS